MEKHYSSKCNISDELDMKHRSHNSKKDERGHEELSSEDELSREHKEVLSDIETCMRKRLEEKMRARYLQEAKKKTNVSESDSSISPEERPNRRGKGKMKNYEHNARKKENQRKRKPSTSVSPDSKSKEKCSQKERYCKDKVWRNNSNKQDSNNVNEDLVKHEREGEMEEHTSNWDVTAPPDDQLRDRSDNLVSTDNAPNSTKEEPNFALSGKLTEYTNTYNGIVIKYNEPSEARKPKTRWRLYPFKGDEALAMLQVHRQSAYLLGRDRKIADIPIDHPSCSKQHAVLQFRLVDHKHPNGGSGHRVKPYIIDLETTNGTFVNNCKIEPRRYVELREKDVLKFGFSSRDYVILHEKSQDDSSYDEEEPLELTTETIKQEDSKEDTKTKKKKKKKHRKT